MGYYIDFTKVSLDDYIKRLMSVRLVPSRMLLRENIEQQFGLLSAAGIGNIAELMTAVKTAKKLSEFSASSGIDEEYLKILKREIKSTVPKPNLFRDFPNLDEATVAALEKEEIRKTTELYDRILSPDKRNEIAAAAGLSDETVLKLAKLTDLSRIQWVNHTFAWMLFELGYDTVEKLAAADADTLHAELNKFNAEHRIYHHPFGLNDMHRVLFAAEEIPLEVEY